MDSGFQLLDSSLCQGNLDSGFQLSMGFLIPSAAFRILKPRIPNFTIIISSDSGFHKQKFPDVLFSLLSAAFIEGDALPSRLYVRPESTKFQAKRPLVASGETT